MAPPFKQATAVDRDRFENEAWLLWRAWGTGWALSTICSDCREMTHCRGKRRARMLCLDCFDQGAR